MVQFNRRKPTEAAAEPATGDLTHDTSNAPKVPRSFTKERLHSYAARLERLDEERQCLVDDMKEVRAEAKAGGFDTKILGIVLRRRKMDAADRMEADDLVDLYERALSEAYAEEKAKSIDEGE